MLSKLKNIFLESRDIINIPDDLKDLGEVTPYIKLGMKAFTLVKNKRIKLFFKSLTVIENNLNDNQKKKLKKYINSKDGMNILGEYIDSVHQTSSQIANCALAILYADSDNETYDKPFKISASDSLRGIDNETVEVFLQITDPIFLSRRQTKGDLPYPVYITDIENIDGEKNPKQFSAQLEMLITYIHTLMTRGLILPDHATSRLGGDYPKAQPYGVGVSSKKYRKLLIRAKTFINS